MARQPITITDVARKAGVGVGTVSRVLNDSPSVSDSTRLRVRDAIAALDYRPSPLGRRLSLRRTLTVGVLVPFFTRPAGVERLRGLVRALGRSRYDLVLFDVETPEQRDEQLEALVRGDRVDGVVVISLVPTDAEVERFAAAGIPVVLVDAHHPALPTITIDDVAGGDLATSHLLALGHRRIGFVGDPRVNPFGFTSSNDRRRGYLQALERAGADLDPALQREGPHGRHIAHRLTRELLELPEPPTAIFAASDTQALGVLEAARASGVSIPGELSVIGFDDIEVAAYVGLSTVRQPFHQSGVRGAELLLAALDGPLEPLEEELPLELVVRATTAVPAS
jgi:LacI family transcriptional regulator